MLSKSGLWHNLGRYIENYTVFGVTYELLETCISVPNSFWDGFAGRKYYKALAMMNPIGSFALDSLGNT
jgi:hypothetical protein